MTTCDLCGNKNGPFYKGDIEGTKMNVCTNCKSHAKEAWLIKETLPEEPKKKLLHSQQQREQEKKEEQERGEIVQVIVSNYGELIKQAREKKQLKQEVLAKMLAIKESELHTWESNKRKPRQEMARKIEKALGITLIEHQEMQNITSKTKPGAGMTIADLIKKR